MYWSEYFRSYDLSADNVAAADFHMKWDHDYIAATSWIPVLPHAI